MWLLEHVKLYSLFALYLFWTKLVYSMKTEMHRMD